MGNMDAILPSPGWLGSIFNFNFLLSPFNFELIAHLACLMAFISTLTINFILQLVGFCAGFNFQLSQLLVAVLSFHDFLWLL